MNILKLSIAGLGFTLFAWILATPDNWFTVIFLVPVLSGFLFALYEVAYFHILMTNVEKENKALFFPAINFCISLFVLAGSVLSFVLSIVFENIEFYFIYKNFGLIEILFVIVFFVRISLVVFVNKHHISLLFIKDRLVKKFI